MDRLEEEHAEFAATYEPEVQKRSQVGWRDWQDSRRLALRTCAQG